MLIISPKLFFTVLPGCPNLPRIDFSYYKYICPKTHLSPYLWYESGLLSSLVEIKSFWNKNRMVDMLKFESGILQACQMAATTRSHYGKFTPKSTKKYAEFLFLICIFFCGWTNAKKTIIFDNYRMTV